MNIQFVATQTGSVAQQQHVPEALTAAFEKSPQIQIITDINSFLSIEPQWRKLETDNQVVPTVFQSFEWVKAWCLVYLDGESSDKLYIITGLAQGKLVFAFPIVRSNRHGMRTLQWLTEPLGQYGDVLCAKGQDANFWLDKSIDLIRTLNDIDILRLRHIRKDSVIAPFMSVRMIDAKYDERAPYLDLQAFKTEADYDARYTSTQRKRRKKIRKALGDRGTLHFADFSAGLELDHAIEQAIIEKNAWLWDRGRFNRVMGCPKHITFLKTLSRSTSQTFNMTTSQLQTGDVPVSWEIGFRYRGTHFAYITSHVNALTDLSPGRLHMDLSQRSALAAGLKKFDLMVPYDLHKESWSSGLVDASDCYFPFTSSGKLYGALYLRLLRPIVRKLYYKLPKSALRILQACWSGSKP